MSEHKSNKGLKGFIANLKSGKKKIQSNPRHRIITLEKPTSAAAEAYRRIKVSLDYTTNSSLKVIQVCSAGEGEGKSLTLLNLAATYIEDNKKVIVIDLDFRRPVIHKCFRIENTNGITDVLVNKLDLNKAIRKTRIGIDFIPRGTKAPYPTALLASSKMKEIIEELKKEYDYILIDCPPILAVSDSLVVSNYTDGILFVVNQKVSNKEAVKEAVENLKTNGVKILGVVLAGVDEKNQNYYNYRYNRYYKTYYSYNNKPQPENRINEDEFYAVISK